MKIKVLLLGKKEACTQVQLALRDEDISVAGSVSDENRVLDEISRTQPNLILVTEASPMALRLRSPEGALKRTVTSWVSIRRRWLAASLLACSRLRTMVRLALRWSAMLLASSKRSGLTKTT
mgnify:CR=1 FL=1